MKIGLLGGGGLGLFFNIAEGMFQAMLKIMCLIKNFTFSFSS
jgi:hypothetical protein